MRIVKYTLCFPVYLFFMLTFFIWSLVVIVFVFLVFCFPSISLIEYTWEGLMY